MALRRMGKLDFKELEAFQAKMESLVDRIKEEFYPAAAKELAARLLSLVIPRTPVGKGAFEIVRDDLGKAARYKKGARKGANKLRRLTNGGTLRRGWTARTEADAGGGGRQSPAAFAQSLDVERHGGVFSVEIVNPVHYASYVEFGHRQKPGRFIPELGKQTKSGWVKGRFMMTLSENQLREMGPSILARKLEKFLKEALGGT